MTARWVGLVVLAIALARASAAAAGGCEVGDAEDCAAKCSKHDDEACGVLGIMLAAGRGVAKDVDRGARLVQAACTAKVARACVDAAALAENGLGVPKDEAKAKAVYEKACTKDRFAYGCIKLAGIYETGHGVAVDLGKAAELYEHACDTGDARGCTQLGRMREQAGDKAGAKEHYKAGCDHGDPSGCAGQAALFDKRDHPDALALYQRACDHHHWVACSRLAYVRASGLDGGVMDLATAVPLYERSCDHYELDACNNLGAIYAAGNGIAQDATKAKAYYQRACDGGNASGCKNLVAPIVPVRPPPTPTDGSQDETACEPLEGTAQAACFNNIGVAYEKGWTSNRKRRTGLKQDKTKAAALYRKACDLGEPSGCVNLGSAMFLGGGVDKDVPTGLKLLHGACFTDGNQVACDYLKKLPSWAQDAKLVKALPAWAKDGPIDPTSSGDGATGPGCAGFWRALEKHVDSSRVAKMKSGPDIALARLAEAKRPDSVGAEIWNGCGALWKRYIKQNRDKLETAARAEEAEADADAARTDDDDRSSGSPSTGSPRNTKAAEKKQCMDRCFKEYSKCHQPRTGPSICQPAKQRCEKSC